MRTLGVQSSFKYKAISHKLNTLAQRPTGAFTTMPIAKLIIEIEIPHAQSLKDRRQVVRSMKDKLRHGFNLSIAELDETVAWNRATLGIVAISNSTSYLTGQIQQIDEAALRIATGLSAEVLDSFAEILPE
ncbi:hypothetical protein BH10ACI4_BH10ACI4_19990 [soil metagenome]